MPIPNDQKELEEMFARLGAKNPADWARSQSLEGIEQMHRFPFLREAWRLIQTPDDPNWIDIEIELLDSQPHNSNPSLAHPLQRLLAQAANPQDLTEVTREIQIELMFKLCSLLDDPGFPESELRDIGWRLVTTDENREPTNRQISALHESVSDTDPTRIDDG